MRGITEHICVPQSPFMKLNFAGYRDASVRNNIERIFTIWQERGVFESEFVDELMAILSMLLFMIFVYCFTFFKA